MNNTKFKCYLDEISYIFNRKVSNPITGFIEAIQRSLFWAKKMWKNYDFDAVYMLEMNMLKLEQMSKCFKEGCAEGSYENSLIMDNLIMKAKRALWLFENSMEEKDLEEAQQLTEEFYSEIAKNTFKWWD